MNSYMKVAFDLSLENLETKAGGPFGACVVKDGKIIGSASNQVIQNHDPTAHAEVLAIREAAKNLHTHDLSGCEIYTTCYPCPMCLSAIMWANIHTIYYGNTKEDADKIGFRDDFIYSFLNHMQEKQELLEFHQVDHEETIRAFLQYDKDENKVQY